MKIVSATNIFFGSPRKNMTQMREYSFQILAFLLWVLLNLEFGRNRELRLGQDGLARRELSRTSSTGYSAEFIDILLKLRKSFRFPL